MPDRLADDELWRCVGVTLRDVILPAIDADHEWARVAAIQLVGLARYAETRPADPAGGRTAELASALASLADNPSVADAWDGDATDASVQAAVGAVLARAVVAPAGDPSHAAADVLRPITVAHLDDELAITGPLVDAFRGRLPAPDDEREELS